MEKYPVHCVMRKWSFGIMEHMATVEKISILRFKFIGFPLKLAGTSASPIRAIAVVEVSD